jgi:hypothetical protein
MKRAAILTLSTLLASMPAAGEAVDTLPLDRGYYVRKETPCGKASNATLISFDGIAFGSVHQECSRPSSITISNGVYELWENCRDTQGHGGPWKKLKARYRIISRREFILINSQGEFPLRLCPQTDLPEPWKNDGAGAEGVK